MNADQKLVAAVKKGDVEEAQRLVEWEWASLRYKDKDSGKTPREIAIAMGHDLLIEFLAGEELRDAAKKGDLEAAEALLKSNANVNSQDPWKGDSALHWASRYRHRSMVQLLLHYNAHIDLKAENGFTPLHYASYHGNSVVVQMLLDRNANPTIKTKGKRTAQDWAISNNHDTVVKLFDDFQKKTSGTVLPPPNTNSSPSLSSSSTSTSTSTSPSPSLSLPVKSPAIGGKQYSEEELQSAIKTAVQTERAKMEAQMAKTAKEELEPAKGAAKEAKKAAEEAEKAAKTAQKEAKVAKAAMKTAQDEAEVAKGKTQTAQAEAKTAQEVAQAAQEAANAAQVVARGAQEVAKAAKIETNTAQAEATVAKDKLKTAQAEAKAAQEAANAAKEVARGAQEEAKEAEEKLKTAQDEAKIAQEVAKAAKAEAMVAKDKMKTAQDEAKAAQEAAETTQKVAIAAQEAAIAAQEAAKDAQAKTTTRRLATIMGALAVGFTAGSFFSRVKANIPPPPPLLQAPSLPPDPPPHHPPSPPGGPSVSPHPPHSPVSPATPRSLSNSRVEPLPFGAGSPQPAPQQGLQRHTMEGDGVAEPVPKPNPNVSAEDRVLVSPSSSSQTTAKNPAQDDDDEFRQEPQDFNDLFHHYCGDPLELLIPQLLPSSTTSKQESLRQTLRRQNATTIESLKDIKIQNVIYAVVADQDKATTKEAIDEILSSTYPADINIDDKNEKTLEVGKPFGGGQFEVVRSAVWRPVPGAEIVVAYKELRDEDAVAMEQEFKTWKAIKPHDHVARLYGVVRRNSAIVGLISEKYPHNSIAVRLPKLSVQPSEGDVLKIALGIAQGLHHLHSNGIIHRDLGARNIFLSLKMKPVLGDFGLARANPTDTTYTAKLQSLLPPSVYLAPETLLYRIFSFATDIYTFGVVLWELTHKPNPPSDSSPLQFTATLYPNVRTIFTRCYDPRPEQRPSAAQVVKLIEEVIKAMTEAMEKRYKNNDNNNNNAELEELPQLLKELGMEKFTKPLFDDLGYTATQLRDMNEQQFDEAMIEAGLGPGHRPRLRKALKPGHRPQLRNARKTKAK